MEFWRNTFHGFQALPEKEKRLLADWKKVLETRNGPEYMKRTESIRDQAKKIAGLADSIAANEDMNPFAGQAFAPEVDLDRISKLKADAIRNLEKWLDDPDLSQDKRKVLELAIDLMSKFPDTAGGIGGIYFGFDGNKLYVISASPEALTGMENADPTKMTPKERENMGGAMGFILKQVRAMNTGSRSTLTSDSLYESDDDFRERQRIAERNKTSRMRHSASARAFAVDVYKEIYITMMDYKSDYHKHEDIRKQIIDGPAELAAAKLRSLEFSDPDGMKSFRKMYPKLYLKIIKDAAKHDPTILEGRERELVGKEDKPEAKQMYFFLNLLAEVKEEQPSSVLYYPDRLKRVDHWVELKNERNPTDPEMTVGLPAYRQTMVEAVKKEPVLILTRAIEEYEKYWTIDVAAEGKHEGQKGANIYKQLVVNAINTKPELFWTYWIKKDTFEIHDVEAAITDETWVRILTSATSVPRLLRLHEHSLTFDRLTTYLFEKDERFADATTMAVVRNTELFMFLELANPVLAKRLIDRIKSSKIRRVAELASLPHVQEYGLPEPVIMNRSMAGQALTTYEPKIFDMIDWGADNGETIKKYYSHLHNSNRTRLLTASKTDANILKGIAQALAKRPFERLETIAHLTRKDLMVETVRIATDTYEITYKEFAKFSAPEPAKNAEYSYTGKDKNSDLIDSANNALREMRNARKNLLYIRKRAVLFSRDSAFPKLPKSLEPKKPSAMQKGNAFQKPLQKPSDPTASSTRAGPPSLTPRQAPRVTEEIASPPANSSAPPASVPNAPSTAVAKTPAQLVPFFSEEEITKLQSEEHFDNEEVIRLGIFNTTLRLAVEQSTIYAKSLNVAGRAQAYREAWKHLEEINSYIHPPLARVSSKVQKKALAMVSDDVITRIETAPFTFNETDTKFEKKQEKSDESSVDRTEPKIVEDATGVDAVPATEKQENSEKKKVEIVKRAELKIDEHAFIQLPSTIAKDYAFTIKIGDREEQKIQALNNPHSMPEFWYPGQSDAPMRLWEGSEDGKTNTWRITSHTPEQITIRLNDEVVFEKPAEKLPEKVAGFDLTYDEKESRYTLSSADKPIAILDRSNVGEGYNKRQLYFLQSPDYTDGYTSYGTYGRGYKEPDEPHAYYNSFADAVKALSSPVSGSDSTKTLAEKMVEWEVRNKKLRDETIAYFDTPDSPTMKLGLERVGLDFGTQEKNDVFLRNASITFLRRDDQPIRISRSEDDAYSDKELYVDTVDELKAQMEQFFQKDEFMSFDDLSKKKLTDRDAKAVWHYKYDILKLSGEQILDWVKRMEEANSELLSNYAGGIIDEAYKTDIRLYRRHMDMARARMSLGLSMEQLDSRIQEFVDKSPNDVTVLREAGEAFLQYGTSSKGEKILVEATKKGDVISAFVLYARYITRDPEKAEQILERSLQYIKKPEDKQRIQNELEHFRKNITEKVKDIPAPKKEAAPEEKKQSMLEQVGSTFQNPNWLTVEGLTSEYTQLGEGLVNDDHSIVSIRNKNFNSLLVVVSIYSDRVEVDNYRRGADHSYPRLQATEMFEGKSVKEIIDLVNKHIAVLKQKAVIPKVSDSEPDKEIDFEQPATKEAVAKLIERSAYNEQLNLLHTVRIEEDRLVVDTKEILIQGKTIGDVDASIKSYLEPK